MKKALSITLLFLLTACAGTNFNWDNARKIKQGMTEQELVALMGKPYMVKSANGELTYIWSHANMLDGKVRTVSTVLIDGKVKEAPQIPDSF